MHSNLFYAGWPISMISGELSGMHGTPLLKRSYRKAELNGWMAVIDHQWQGMTYDKKKYSGVFLLTSVNPERNAAQNQQ